VTADRVQWQELCVSCVEPPGSTTRESLLSSYNHIVARRDLKHVSNIVGNSRDIALSLDRSGKLSACRQPQA
jgi:hypothetical protein